MTGTLAIKDISDSTDIRWTPMVILSVVLHLTAFLMILFLPGSISFPYIRHADSIIYEVDLVELPKSALKENSSDDSALKSADRNSQAKRISAPVKKEAPLTIAKRTIEKKSSPKEPDTSSQLIDKAISKIEDKVQPQKTNDDYIEKALSRLDNQAGDSGARKSGAPSEGIIIRLYQAQVESWIKSNWSYPVAAANSRRRLEAVVSLKVKKDGTIVESLIKRRSGDNIFDQSVMKAIEKSNPLPKFPEGYRKNYEEFEINFNLKDLENN